MYVALWHCNNSVMDTKQVHYVCLVVNSIIFHSSIAVCRLMDDCDGRTDTRRRLAEKGTELSLEAVLHYIARCTLQNCVQTGTTPLKGGREGAHLSGSKP